MSCLGASPIQMLDTSEVALPSLAPVSKTALQTREAEHVQGA